MTTDVDVDIGEELMNATTPNSTWEEQVPYSARPETYFLPLVFAGIFLTGILGNGTLIYMFVSDRKMRNEPNTYIFSLALGDLLLILISVPFIWVIYVLPSWPFGLIVCKLTETVKDLSMGVSVFTLTALSAARYFPVVDPMRTRPGGPGRSAASSPACCSGAIWVVSLLLSGPAAFNSHLIEIPPGSEHVACFPFREGWSCGTVVFHCVVYYAMPLTVIFVFYALMARRLLESVSTIPGERPGYNPGQNRQIRARRKVAKMVLAFVMVFWVCFTPHQIFALWFHCNPSSLAEYDDVWHYFRIFAFCLKFLNSCANPIALYCVSGMFRKKFERHLSWMLPGSRRRRSSSSLLNSSSTPPRRLPPRRRQQRPVTLRSGDCTVTTFMNGAGERT